MDTASFEMGMQILDHRFRGGRRTPEQTAEVYYQRLRYIPSEPWIWCCEQAIEDLRSFPTPGELRSLWYEWKTKFPEKILKAPRTDCQECAGTGYLWAKKEDEELGRLFGHYTATTIFVCGRCNNADGQVPGHARKVTRAQLEAEGYEVEQLDDRPTPVPNKPQELVKEMAKSMLKDFPQAPDSIEFERRRQDQKHKLGGYLDRKSLASGEVDEVPF